MSQDNRLFTILMVDDDPDDRLLFKEACEEVRLRNPLDCMPDSSVRATRNPPLLLAIALRAAGPTLLSGAATPLLPNTCPPRR